MQAARLLERDLVGAGGRDGVARARGGGEEPERVVVGAVHGQRLDDRVGAGGAQPQRHGAVPRGVGAGRPSPTRAGRSSPAGAARDAVATSRARTNRAVAGAGRGARRGRARPVAVGPADVAGDGRGTPRPSRSATPGPGCHCSQLRGPVGVVGEQEVQHRVRLAAPAAFAVGAGPALARGAVRRGAGPPGGLVEHGPVLRRRRGSGGDGSCGHGPTVPAPGGPSAHLPAATTH